jgi:hypothetical protein
MAKLEEQVTPTELVEIILDGTAKQDVIKRFRTSDEELALMLSQQYREGQITKDEFNAFFKGLPVPSRHQEPAPGPVAPPAEEPVPESALPAPKPARAEAPLEAKQPATPEEKPSQPDAAPPPLAVAKAPEAEVAEPEPPRPSAVGPGGPGEPTPSQEWEPTEPSPRVLPSEPAPQSAVEVQEVAADEIIEDEYVAESADVELESVEVEAIEPEVVPEAPKEPPVSVGPPAIDRPLKLVPLTQEPAAEITRTPEQADEPSPAPPVPSPDWAQIVNALQAIIARLSSIDNRLVQIEKKLTKE